MNLDEEERRGPPKRITISERVEKVHYVVLRDGRMKKVLIESEILSN